MLHQVEEDTQALGVGQMLDIAARLLLGWVPQILQIVCGTGSGYELGAKLVLVVGWKRSPASGDDFLHTLLQGLVVECFRRQLHKSRYWAGHVVARFPRLALLSPLRHSLLG